MKHMIDGQLHVFFFQLIQLWLCACWVWTKISEIDAVFFVHASLFPFPLIRDEKLCRLLFIAHEIFTILLPCSLL